MSIAPDLEKEYTLRKKVMNQKHYSASGGDSL
jgi:hypothetical protein